MKKVFSYMLMTILSTSVFAQTKVIFDTDIGSDCDDAGAMAVLHKLADKGEVEILGVVYSSGKNKFGIGVCDAVNTYYGRGDLPLGQNHKDDVGDPRDFFSKQIATDTGIYHHDVISSAKDLVSAYKMMLEKEQDASVTIITVGHPIGLVHLLGDDEGVRLVRSKVNRWVAMGGGGWNFSQNGMAEYMHELLKKWPCKLYMSSYGEKVITGNIKLPNTPEDNPVRKAYESFIWNCLEKGRPSWDQIAVLFAVRPQYFRIESHGSVEQTEDKSIRWNNRTNNPKHYYVLPKISDVEMRDIIEDLMSERPGSAQRTSSSKYLDVVRTFADNALKYGRDTYGSKHTPLFVDGLNVNTHEPVKWISPKGDLSETTETEEWILSNLASQQNLFRTLDGLTKITGDPKYRQAAMEAIEYAFANLRSPNGLLYWGIYTAYDAQGDKVMPEDSVHILKANLPYYELMWQVNPEATKRFIESFWSAHIKDWLHLDMDRIGRFNDRLEEPWNHKYEEGPVYLKSGGGIPFLNAGTDLLYAAVMLTKLSGDEEPLVWAKRLAYRYVRTRHPNTGISYYMYKKPPFTIRDSYDSVTRKIQGEETNGHFIDCFPWVTYVESKRGMKTPTPVIPINEPVFFWQAQFLVGEMLAGEGDEFKQWALEELTAFGKASYRKQDNVYVPVLTDGTNIDGYLVKENGWLGPRGVVLQPTPVWPSDLWSYAMGYRVTKDAFMWEMARNIAKGNKYGDIGAVPKEKTQLNDSVSSANPYVLLAFLELYMATGKSELLNTAKIIGDNILDSRFHKGFFAASNEHVYTKFDAIDSLAFLHLHSALTGETAEIPHAWPCLPYFNCPYRLRGYMNDNYLLYTRTDPSEPALTIQEAAIGGDIELVRSLLESGADLDYSDDGNKTPLQLAAMNGHEEVAELLLAKGARIDAQESYPGRTALDYAVEKGHKGMVELLINKGADVNIKTTIYPKGDTPLHTAVKAGHKDIVELLIGKDVDLNAKNDKKRAPIDIAMRKPHIDIASVLIDNGAEASFFTKMRLSLVRQEKGIDINARDSEGNTSLYYAARGGHGKLAQLLIEKGADVTVKDARGMTPLYFAATNGMDAVVELIIVHDNVDVNVQTDRGWAPLHMAAAQGHRKVVQSLVNHGADINVKNKGGKTPLYFARRGGYTEIIEILTKAAEEQKATKVATSKPGDRDH